MFELVCYVAGLFLHCCSELKRMLVKKQRGKNYAPQLAHKAPHTRIHNFTTTYIQAFKGTVSRDGLAFGDVLGSVLGLNTVGDAAGFF